MKKFYVYCYKDPSSDEFFYIGYGSKTRSMQHLWFVLKYYDDIDYDIIGNQRYNKIKELIDEGKEPKIEILKENLTRKEAMQLEHDMIVKIGRKDLGTGPLLNLTNGFEFCKNGVYCEPSSKAISEGKKRFYQSEQGAIVKEYLSNLYSGKKIGTPEEWLGFERGLELRKTRSMKAKQNTNFSQRDRNVELNPFFGRKHRDDAKKRISEARTGVPMTVETKEKISDTLKKKGANKGPKNYQAKPVEVKHPDGSIEILNGNICAWAYAHKMSPARIYELCNGQREIYKGYSAMWLKHENEQNEQD